MKTHVYNPFDKATGRGMMDATSGKENLAASLYTSAAAQARYNAGYTRGLEMKARPRPPSNGKPF